MSRPQIAWPAILPPKPKFPLALRKHRVALLRVERYIHRKRATGGARIDQESGSWLAQIFLWACRNCGGLIVIRLETCRGAPGLDENP